MTNVRKRSSGAESFYCSWGKHRTYPPPFNGTFPQGTMCLDCQLAIAESLRMFVPMPDLTAGLVEAERRRKVKDKSKAATVARATADRTGTGFVYYMLINEQIKIGYAADVTERMRHYPPGSKLLAIEPGTYNTERERHQDFSRDLVRGREWFAPSEKLMKWIDQLVSELGDPSALAYEYTQRTTR